MDAGTWASMLDVALFPARVAVVALGVLGAMGAVLSVTGIFGMAAYSVSRPKRELGIRVALDVVLDTIGGETRERSWRVLRKGGALVTLVSPIPAGVAEQQGVRGMFFIVRGNRGQLDQISALVDEGKLKPVTAEVLPLARGREAFELGAEIHSPGKIVLQARAA